MTPPSMVAAVRAAFADDEAALIAYDRLIRIIDRGEQAEYANTVAHLVRVVDAAHIRHGLAGAPGYTVTESPRTITAPDGSTYGQRAIRRYT